VDGTKLRATFLEALKALLTKVNTSAKKANRKTNIDLLLLFRALQNAPRDYISSLAR
jgi:hypothetical protein